MELIPLAKKDTPQQPEEELSSGDSLKLDLYFWLQALVMALVALILVFTLVGRIIGVDGNSMYPTLHHKDMLLLQSIGYEPRQGDVVVLTKAFDTVTDLDEPYINEAMIEPYYENLTSLTVPEGSIFVMGDNRNHSSDSRYVALGVVDERYVLGRALLILLPFGHFGPIPAGAQTV